MVVELLDEVLCAGGVGDPLGRQVQELDGRLLALSVGVRG